MEKQKVTNNINIQLEDFQAVLKEMQTYVDITDEDLMQIYLLAVEHAKKRMAGGMPACDVMIRNVVSVHMDDTVEAVMNILLKHDISGLPVVDENQKVIGVISEADFVKRLVPKGASNTGKLFSLLKKEEHAALTVEDAMTTPAIVSTENTSLTKIASIMVRKNINRVPIVDANKRLIGIIARSDIVKALYSKGNE